MSRLTHLLKLGFPGGIPLAWRQLTAERKRFMVAIAGVSFGSLLMLFQLGIYQAFMVMTQRPIQALEGDVIMVSPNFEYLLSTPPFPERRLTQTLADPEVSAVYPLMISNVMWRVPDNGETARLALFGVRPHANAFNTPSIRDRSDQIVSNENLIYDQRSKPSYGSVQALLQERGPFMGEINHLRVRVADTFELGETLAAYGHAIMSLDGFRRVTGRLDYSIELGLITLHDPKQAKAVIERLSANLTPDVRLMTRQDFLDMETTYWMENTPVGFIVLAGLLIAMLVGAVIVYQILYTDINDHIKEYATLKAMGMSDGFFGMLVLQQASILPVLGMVPALVLSAIMFHLATTVGGLPASLTLRDTGIVLVLSIAMCVVAGWLAMRRLQAADPADIF
jgi:putative ABC transport system permease protein